MTLSKYHLKLLHFNCRRSLIRFDISPLPPLDTHCKVFGCIMRLSFVEVIVVSELLISQVIYINVICTSVYDNQSYNFKCTWACLLILYYFSTQKISKNLVYELTRAISSKIIDQTRLTTHQPHGQCSSSSH